MKENDSTNVDLNTLRVSDSDYEKLSDGDRVLLFILNKKLDEFLAKIEERGSIIGRSQLFS